MNGNLKLVSLAFLIFIIILILSLVKREKISTKYSIVWLITTFILLLFVIFPGILNFFTKLLGFEVGANMILTGLIVLLICINIALTVIVSNQSEKIKLLIQEVSLIKQKNGMTK